jgi:hypothetical protein
MEQETQEQSTAERMSFLIFIRLYQPNYSSFIKTGTIISLWIIVVLHTINLIYFIFFLTHADWKIGHEIGYVINYIVYITPTIIYSIGFCKNSFKLQYGSLISLQFSLLLSFLVIVAYVVKFIVNMDYLMPLVCFANSAFLLPAICLCCTYCMFLYTKTMGINNMTLVENKGKIHMTLSDRRTINTVRIPI